MTNIDAMVTNYICHMNSLQVCSVRLGFFFPDCNSNLIQHSNCSMTKMLNVLVV